MDRILALTCLYGILSPVYCGHFFGGSMSYQGYEENGSLKVKLRLLTGWKLGSGPCGPHCNESMLGMDTMDIRQDVLQQKHDQSFFGKWIMESRYTVKGKSTLTNLTVFVRSNTVERVLMINTDTGWELEAADLMMPLPGDSLYSDIIYEGDYRVPLSCQPNVTKWHLQTKIYINHRSDTGNVNSSPIVMAKPFYRLALNRKHTLHFPAVDVDDDVYRCRWPRYIEAGVLSNPKTKRLSGVSIKKNCVFSIDTDSAHYNVNDTGAIAISVEDYSRSFIELKGQTGPVQFSPAYKHALSAVTLQFYIEIVEDIGEPFIISPPTPPVMQIFIVYVGTEFSVDIYAKPSAPSRSIDRIILQTRNNEKLTVTDMVPRNDIGLKVVMVTARWMPSSTDIGDHIFAAEVRDDQGYESTDLHTFIVKVKAYNHIAASSKDSPRFIDFPKAGPGGIGCPVNTICAFPIYAASDSYGGIQNISVVSTEIRQLNITCNETFEHIQTKMARVEIHALETGDRKICLEASDLFAVVHKCLFVRITSKDPCEDLPCRHSGQCVPNEENSDYRCMCEHGTSGKNCEIVIDLCEDNPCLNNGTCQVRTFLHRMCSCTDGYTGFLCDQVVDLCTPYMCGENGVCEQQDLTVSCHCANGYTGSNCTTLGMTHVDICKNDSCPEHSVCIPDGDDFSFTCACIIGYSSEDCTEGQFDKVTTDSLPRFVAPTPGTGTIIQCDEYNNYGCYFGVYVLHGHYETGNYPAHISVDITRSGYELFHKTELNMTARKTSIAKRPTCEAKLFRTRLKVEVPWNDNFTVNTLIQSHDFQVVTTKRNDSIVFDNGHGPSVFFIPVEILNGKSSTPAQKMFDVCLGVALNRSPQDWKDRKCFHIRFSGQDTDGELATKLYDKRDDFSFPIVDFPHLSCNIPQSSEYGVYISQMIRYARACTTYEDFIYRVWHNNFETSNKDTSHSFMSPTPGENSTFTCDINKRCSFFVYTKPMDGSNVTECGSVVIPNKVRAGASPPKLTSGVCQTEIVLRNSSVPTTQRVCLKAWSNGSSRCFDAKFMKPIDVCSTQSCKNDGICESLENGTFMCHCLTGYRGNHCEIGRCSDRHCNNNGICFTDALSKLCYCDTCFYGESCEHKSDTLSTGKINELRATKALEIECNINKPCHVVFELTSPSGSITTVEPGGSNDDIEFEDLTHEYTSQCLSKVITVIVGRVIGLHLVCITVTLNTGTTEDICSNVTVINGAPLLVNKMKPYFVAPTMPNGTVIQCVKEMACHISLWVSNRQGINECPSLKSDRNPEESVYISKPKVETRSCMFDVTFHANAAISHIDVCFMPTSPLMLKIGGDGEHRCYQIVPKETPEMTKCLHGGVAVRKHENGMNETCICPVGITGYSCSQVGGLISSNHTLVVMPNPGVKHRITDIALPKMIYCDIHSTCGIPVLVTGDPNLSPNIVSQNSFVSTPIAAQSLGDGHKGTYQINIKVQSPETGKNVACVQVMDSLNLADELCFGVTFTNSSNGNRPQGSSYCDIDDRTLPDKSIIICEEKSVCHTLVYTASHKQGDSTCKDIHLSTSTHTTKVIGTWKVDNKTCVTDIGTNVEPQMSEQQICFHVDNKNFSSNCEPRCLTMEVYKDIILAKSSSIVSSTPSTETPTDDTSMTLSLKIETSKVTAVSETMKNTIGFTTPKYTEAYITNANIQTSTATSKSTGATKSSVVSSYRQTTLDTTTTSTTKSTGPDPGVVTENQCLSKARTISEEAAVHGRVVCFCKDVASGHTQRIININPIVPLSKKLRAGVIGGIGSCMFVLTVTIVHVIYRQFSKSGKRIIRKQGVIKPYRK